MLNSTISDNISSPPINSYTRNGIQIKIFVPDESELQRNKTDVVIKEKLCRILNSNV